MQRNMPKIVGLLKSIDMKRDEGGGAVFPDGYFDDPQNAHEKHFLPLLIEAGFVAEVAGQAEICDFKTYRITWKGHCLIDLFFANHSSDFSHDPLMVLLRDNAIFGFH